MNLTIVDWYGFRTKAQVPDAKQALRDVFGSSGGAVTINHRKGGYRGAEQSADLCLGDMHVGLMYYGGESQRGWLNVSLSGRGCEWIADWKDAEAAVSELPEYETRRVDIALDTCKGESSHDKVLQAYRAGMFNSNGAGRPPKMHQILPEDLMDGRTIYVGDREQAKFLRAYEKGLELTKNLRTKGLNITHVDEVPVNDLYRLELELKPKNGPLPEDLIQKRDQYFAGAYPYLNSVLEVEPEVFTQRRERGPQRDMQAALEHIKFQFGSTLFTALTAHGGDISAVWEKIVGTKHNQKLVEAGVLLVDHA